MTSRVTITFSERIKIYEHLKKVLFQIEGTKYWEYDEGWDDLKVALHVGQQINRNLNKYHTKHVRQEMFGPVRTTLVDKHARLDERIERLETIVNALTAEFGINVPSSNPTR